MANTLLTALSLAALATTPILASDVWTVNCAPLTQQRADPICQPGVEFSVYVHAVVGGTAFSSNETGIYDAVNANATTCDKFTDHSNYWCPQLYHMRPDGMFDLLEFTGAVMYYENYTCDYHPSGVCDTPREANAFPQGLRMIAGDSLRRTLNLTDQWEQAILTENGNSGEVYGLPATLDGGRLSGHVRFPSCWDGVNIDSADHQSHMAYPDPTLGGTTQGGMCPSSHPVSVINIGAEFGFNLNGVTDPTTLVFANGDTTGFGFHGDFYQGWTNSTALQESFSTCIDSSDCPWELFDSPTGMAIIPTAYAPQTPPPYENIGLTGPIAALPGDNPVYTGPRNVTVG